MSDHQAWYRRFSHAGLALLAASSLVVLLLLASVFDKRVLALAAFDSPPTVEAPPPSTADHAADQEKRVTAALADLDKKTSGQQTLIGSLATLTGLYVIILSAAAYFRLQQTKDETQAADTRIRALEDRAGKDLDTFQKKIATESEEAMRKIKLDIPAMHGIGRRLEELRIELDQRLPVDGDWSYAYDLLSQAKRQQALIDEMVINSLDLFSLPEDIRDRRTVSRLYTSLGQFYFGRASHKRASAAKLPPAQATEITELKDLAHLDLLRARLYFHKAHVVDDTDPVSLRALGTGCVHEASWKKEDQPALGFDDTLIIKATAYFEQSLAINRIEPGACMGRAWLHARATPPAYLEAIDLLTRVIDAEKATTLSFSMVRKYLSSILFNRAAYRAHILDAEVANGGKGTDQLGEVEKDLRDGLAATKDQDAAKRFRNALNTEKDFDALCQRDPDFAQVVAEITST